MPSRISRALVNRLRRVRRRFVHQPEPVRPEIVGSSIRTDGGVVRVELDVRDVQVRAIRLHRRHTELPPLEMVAVDGGFEIAVGALLPEGPRAAVLDVYLVVPAATAPEGEALVRFPCPEGEPDEIVLRTTTALDDGRALWAYATRERNLSLRVATVRHQMVALSDVSIGADGSRIELAATVETTLDVDHATLRFGFVGRPAGLHQLPVESLEPSVDGFKRVRTSRIRSSVDLSAMFVDVPELGGADTMLPVVEAAGRPGPDGLPTVLRRVLRPGARAVPAGVVEVPLGGAGRLVRLVAYRTFRSRAYALRFERTTVEDVRAHRRVLRRAWWYALQRPFARVWLVGETPYKAQESGFRLFRWIRENHPDQRVYYVIDAESPERAKVDALGNAVLAGSPEHARLTLMASRFVSTHHLENLFATRSPRLQRWAGGRRVFIQHGVLGVKNLVALYGRLRSDFRTDRFLVSSEREREIIINDFEYHDDQVVVTGLARFDRLFEPAETPPAGVLIVPTWRDWLQSEQAVLESDYLTAWRELLLSDGIRRLIEAGHPVRLIMHPNMRHFAPLFEVPGVTLILQGERDVQDLMRESAALVTDYSSVGLDFSFLHRPVFYLQFDRARYLGRRGSHLDLDADLPGAIYSVPTELTEALVVASREGFVMSDVYRARADRLIDHRDRSNTQRVYDAIRSTRGPRVLSRRFAAKGVSRRTYARFRKSRAYTPAMKALFAVAKLMPRADVAVFESANGKQYSDSPRAVYEEMVRRGLGLRYVWVGGGNFRPVDVGTRKIVRRSPRYFWTLGRARYWVANQSFAPELQPSPRTTYLQTWHGTPLKRMQHDAISTAGRDEGYLGRVTRMMRAWDLLVSPSPYATEKFRSAFRYEGPVLEVGYPRNDLFHGPARAQVADLVRRRLQLPAGVRVALYAPTFRDAARTTEALLRDTGLDWEQVAAGLPDDMVLLVRTHSIVKGSLGIPVELRARIVDVTRYPDMQDLLLVADVLVTDYSSSMFDFASLGRPMVFFCYDLEQYRDNLRGFYLDFEADAPGPIVRDADALVAALNDLGGIARRYADQLDAFARTYAPLDDGKAAARVVDALVAPSN